MSSSSSSKKALTGVAAVTAAQLATKDLNDYLTIVLSGAAEASWAVCQDTPSVEHVRYAREIIEQIAQAGRRAGAVTNALHRLLGAGAASAAMWPKS